MEIKRVEGKFEVVKWSPRPFGKQSDGTMMQVINNWGIGTSIREGIDGDSTPVMELILTLIYEIKGFLQFDAKDHFVVYNYKDAANAFQYATSAILTLNQQMREEFLKRKKSFELNDLPPISHASLLDLTQKLILHIRDFRK